MTQEVKNKLLEAAKIIGAITIIQGGIIAIATPFVNQHIEERIKDYHNSADFKLYVDGVVKTYEEKSRIHDSNKMDLRSLLADKMGIASDEVHIKIGDMYRHRNDFKERIGEIIREIKYYHDDTILIE